MWYAYCYYAGFNITGVMIKYLLALISCFYVQNISAQESVILELQNKSIDEFKFPIKINEVRSTLNQNVGQIYIPELKKNYPIVFAESIEETFGNYISFLQTGETYLDTINLHIKQLKIKERVKGNEEESVLDLTIEFYKGNFKSKRVYAVFSDQITISDPNISVFHEYNVRKGINQSLKWFLNQPISSIFKTLPTINISFKPNKSIQNTNNTKVFIAENTPLSAINHIEAMALKLKEPTINRLVRKRKFVESLGSTFGVVGVITGLVGYAQYKSGNEKGGSEIITGGIIGFIAGGVIWMAGEQQYKANLIREYNKAVLGKNDIVFTPYNPIKIGFSIPLK